VVSRGGFKVVAWSAKWMTRRTLKSAGLSLDCGKALPAAGIDPHDRFPHPAGCVSYIQMAMPAGLRARMLTELL